MSDEGELFTLRLLTSLATDVSREDWDALVGDGSPFLEWGWLASLEESRCVGGRTGWSPQHLAIFSADDRLVAACPMYLKTNGEGEFVFDWSWAQAAHRVGIDWYPKMLVAVPFTPVTGARFLVAPGVDRRSVLRILARALRGLCEENGLSSVHVNFCTPDEVEVLREEGWLEYRSHQYKWRNYGYETFEDWLGALRHKRRKQIRRERRELDEQDVRIEALCGDDIPPELFEPMYRIYATTVDKHTWGRRYLNPDFFALLAERFRHNLRFLVARRRGELVAGTFNVAKSGVLYGRYWGCFEELRFLHFNLCYYATIEHCIDTGIRRFEPGAGGDFKWLRGFDAEPTTSMHWVRDPRLFAALDRHFAAENAAADREIAALYEGSQLKHGEIGEPEGEE